MIGSDIKFKRWNDTTKSMSDVFEGLIVDKVRQSTNKNCSEDRFIVMDKNRKIYVVSVENVIEVL